MSANTWATVLITAIGFSVPIIITIVSCAFWLGSKLSTIATKLDHAEQTDVVMWKKLDIHDQRLDQHGRLISDHSAQIDGIKSNCKDFRKLHERGGS